MNSKLINFVDQCGALELTETYSFTLDDLKRFDSLIRADQRATDAALAHNFPFSPSIGIAIAEIIRCWRDEPEQRKAANSRASASLYCTMQDPVQGSTK